MTAVATIRTIARFPVKSMRGETLTATELSLQGIPGDRRFAFVQAGSRSLFPWLTGRQLAAMLRYQPVYSDAAGQPSVQVRTPNGAELPVESDELRAELEAASGRPLFLSRDYRGSYDVAQFSLIGLPTVAAIATMSGTEPEPGRFRMSFYIDPADGAPFAEDAWVGRVLRLGDMARVAITEPDGRCAMITLDPFTGEAAPAVLRAVAQERQGNAGVYGVVLTPGPVAVGDAVYLES